MKFNHKQYIQIFVKVLKIEKNLVDKIYKRKINIFFNNFKKWDSINHVRILVMIEKKFNIKINHKNAKFFRDYNQGYNYLKKKL